MKYPHERGEKRRGSKPSSPVVLPSENQSALFQMQSYLSSRGLSPGLAIENGWYPTIDESGYPRVVIPTSTIKNTWPYYQARLTIPAPLNVPRYRSPAAPRGDALAVVYPSRTHRGVIVVEGPMDSLAAAMMGFIGVGLMGATPGDEVLDHLEHIMTVYRGDESFVIPDRDAVEEGAVIISKLWARGISCQLRTLVGAKDLAEMSPEHRTLWFGS